MQLYVVVFPQMCRVYLHIKMINNHLIGVNNNLINLINYYFLCQLLFTLERAPFAYKLIVMVTLL